MPNSDIPFVTVIGGFWGLTRRMLRRPRLRIRRSELNSQRLGLVLSSTSRTKNRSNPHVVSGYAAALKDGAGVIRVRYAESQRGQVGFGA